LPNCLPITNSEAGTDVRLFCLRPSKAGKVNPSEVSGQNALVRSIEEGGLLQRRLPNHTLSELLIPLSGAIDLAEGRLPGHAQRVAFIAMSLAEAARLDGETRLAICYAALMHDVGVIAAGAGLAPFTRGDERKLFAALPLLTPEEVAVGTSDTPEVVVDRVVDHAIHGARTAQELGLPGASVRAIAAHHESWNGGGYPHGLSGEEIPVTGRTIALADQIESMISQATPLQARRNAAFWLGGLTGNLADPHLVDTFRDVAAGDSFWLGLFNADLSAELMHLCSQLRESKRPRLLPLSDTFAHLVDSRFSFTNGVSAQVARLVESLGRAVGLSESRLKLLRVAALLHDVGQLAVSERILSKPGILSVEELEMLWLHPAYSRDIVAEIPGLEEVATWIGAHHERLDGRGYPEGRSSEEIPMEARMLAIADAYVAITSDRPHRPRAEAVDASRRLRSAAGSQLDQELVEVFLAKVVR
jgi:HD-GYP domain-containing protein (c-di-GMP phosphodiesterase class II)